MERTPDTSSVRTGHADSDAAFEQDHYLIRRQVFTLFHTNMHVYDAAGALALYTRMKGFRLKEDLRLYADESMQRELLAITTQQVIDFAAAYQVHDAARDEAVGSLERRGLKSMMRDEWLISDAEDRELAIIREDSMAKALVRRFLDFAAFLMPQRYHGEIDGTTVVTYRQHFNPFVHKLVVDFSDPDSRLDRRLALAAGVLLMAIEGRQS